ncbi:MAG: tetratricopeptide repeat protein [Bryobacterales bacterium]|nr:tetratricopeptide repeat protein [Bryobacterales bacterium]
MRALALLAACAALLVGQRPPVEEAWDLLARGERDQAVRLLEKIVKSSPRDADARLLLGSILAEQGDRAGAILHLTEGVRLRPQSAEAQNALGEAYKTFGDWKAARGPFEKAAALDPKFAQARVNLSQVLLEDGDFEAASSHLDRALQLLGNDPEAAFPLYLRAKVYTERNEMEKAMQDLERAVTLQSEFPEAWSDLGQARKNLLDDDGAFAAFKRSVEQDPENAVAQYRLGAEYLRQGKAAEAVTHLEKSMTLSPRNQSTLYSLQLALRQVGQVERAAEIRKRINAMLRERDQESQNALIAVQINNQGADLEKAGKLREALEKYRAAVKLDPEHPGIRTNFAAALLKLGQWKEGIAELREALRRDPENAQLQEALRQALAHAPGEAQR